MRVYVFCFAYVAGHILGGGIPVAFWVQVVFMRLAILFLLIAVELLASCRPLVVGLAPSTLGLEPSTSLGHAWNQIIRYGIFVLTIAGSKILKYI